MYAVVDVSGIGAGHEEGSLMPYTLSMGLLWVLIGVVVGVVIGWLMRSVVAKRQVDRARSNSLDQIELDRLRTMVADLGGSGAPGAAGPADALVPSPGGIVGEASAASVAADDLTAVAGIGPSIAELCEGIGIRSWSDLADTEVSLLRAMLSDAGPRFKTHDPTTWPEQAALLAAGRWDDFAELVARLDPEPGPS